MARHLKRAADIGLTAISVEGGLISPEQLVAIASTAPDAKAAADYQCPKGTSLRDEITRYFRIGQAHWQAFVRIKAPTTTQTAAFVKSLLEQAFGFENLAGPVEHVVEDRRFRIAWEAKGGRVPIVVAAPIEGTDAFTKALPEFGDGSGGGLARRSPTVLLQDWLNTNPDFYWGLVFVGDRVRLMRDNASFTRPTWIEADIGAIFRDEMFADFTALWLLIHGSRFGGEGTSPSDCALERWREAGQRAGTAARDRLRSAVEDALLLLGQGLLDANPALRDKLDRDELSMSVWFEQLLRTVYRLIFLAVAEDRDLLHPPGTTAQARALYADAYGFAYLRERSARARAHDAHHDAWEGIKIVFHALEGGEALLGLPALGGLFGRGLTPDLDDGLMSNRAFLGAIHKLSWLIDDGRRVRINWRDMATEELGSVYEGLLELVPVREEGGRRFGFAGGAEARGNARKISGSYYTPDTLVQTLLDSALDPVLDRAEAEGGVDNILDLHVIDPACGSGHFLLGAARRMATRVAQLRDPDAPDYQAAMRDVVRSCIHGVDRNPMAVELAKVALWIEAIDPGKPLGFLDANIRCGDSLLGVFDLAALDEGIPDDAYKPLTSDDRTAAKYYLQQNKAAKKGQGQFDWSGGGGAMPPRRLAANLTSIKALPEDTVRQIQEKQRRFEAWRSDPARYATRVACDLYMAAFLLPKTEVPLNHGRHMVPTTADVRAKLAGGQIYGPLEGAAIETAGAARAFHWPLAFPDTMIARGGFDVVIGNPPWERIKLQEQEFFASRAPEIAAAANAAERGRLIALMSQGEPGSADRRLYENFQRAKRIAEASSLVFTAPKAEDPTKGIEPTAARRYPWTGRGDVNTYALFAEHFLNLVREGGRAGVIVPTGIATDATTAPFFGHLVTGKRLSSLFSFYEVRKWFVNTDDRRDFYLLTLSWNEPAARFASLLTAIDHLDDPRRVFTLSPADIARINPNTKTAPVFRAKADADLTAELYARVPVLIEGGAGAAGNPWDASFMAMFHMSNDSGLFRTAAQLAEAGYVRDGSYWRREPDAKVAHAEMPLTGKTDGSGFDLTSGGLADDRYAPLFEAKMVQQFNHRFGDGAKLKARPQNTGWPDPTSEEISDPAYEADPWYWVPESAAEERYADQSWDRQWVINWRRSARAGDERTLITDAVPRAGIGDNLFSVLPKQSAQLAAGLLASWNSLVVDYCLRQKAGGANMSYYLIEQLPILPPAAYSEADLAFIVPRVLELTYTSYSMAPFAGDLGYEGPPFAWDEERRAILRAELDAWYGLAYGLSRDEFRYVLDPRQVMGDDYPSETFRVLQKNEIAKYGEYRTGRLVLEAYDRLATAAPDIAGISDGAWEHRFDNPLDVRHALAAVVKKMRGATAPRQVVLAALFAAKPHLLMLHLSPHQKADWRRLVGAEADLPATPSVATFSAATPSAFTDAVQQLRAERAIRYDAETKTWDRGAAIYRYAPLGWADGRAAFVMHAVRSIPVDVAVTTLPMEERSWLALAA